MDKSKNSMPKRSLCDTCCNRFDCCLPDAYGGCFGYERQSNPLDEYVTETRSLNPIKEEKPMRFEEALKALHDSMNNYGKIEITFKSGETISYGKDEWDDYAYDGKAVIVKKNSTWIGIYNFDDVFCVELK